MHQLLISQLEYLCRGFLLSEASDLDIPHSCHLLKPVIVQIAGALLMNMSDLTFLNEQTSH